MQESLPVTLNSPSPSHPASLLVVDDDPDNFDVIDTLLSNQAYDLHYADSGYKAIANLEMFEPDLLLLDVMMPGISGIDVCRQIREHPKWHSLPIIMVTALDSKLSLANCLAAGADDFITKPLNRLELQARIEAMLRLKYQYDALQDLLQQREAMVNMIVHDLRNPLSGLILGLQILSRGKYPAETLPQRITRLTHASQQIQNLVDDLLIMAKQEQGKIRLNCWEVDLVQLVKDVVRDYEVIADQKMITLTVASEEESVIVKVDSPIFHRILGNLLSNAIKFAPDASEIRISVHCPTPTTAAISVADQGPGVDDVLKDKIFEPYEIGTFMPNVSQIGLGLAFCKMMVEAHDGAIAVADNVPKGAILSVEIPRFIPPSEP